MQKLLQAGALALALSGFALGGTIAPAEAATLHYGPPGAGVTIHTGPRYHPRMYRHRLRVCTIRIVYRHHQRVRIRTCRWEWRPFPGRRY